MVDFASQQNKTKQNTADSVVRSGKDSDGIRAVFCFVLGKRLVKVFVSFVRSGFR